MQVSTLFQNTLISLTCPNHPLDPITFLCKTCNQVYNCTQCIQVHQNCNIIMIKQVLEIIHNTVQQSNKQTQQHKECFNEELEQLVQIKQVLIQQSVTTSVQLMTEFVQKLDFYKEKMQKLERQSKMNKKTLFDIEKNENYMFNANKISYEQTSLLLTLIKSVTKIDGGLIFAGKEEQSSKLEQIAEFQDELKEFVHTKYQQLAKLVPQTQRSKSCQKTEEIPYFEDFSNLFNTPSSKRASLNQSYSININNYSTERQTYDFLGVKKPILKGIYNFDLENKSSKISIYSCNRIARLSGQDNYFSSRTQRFHRASINPAFHHSNVLRKQAEIKFKLINLVSYSQLAVGIMKMENQSSNEYSQLVSQLIIFSRIKLDLLEQFLMEQ